MRKLQQTLGLSFQLIVVILFLNITLAISGVGVPHQFYGDVIVNGYPAPDNLKVTVQEANDGVYDNESTIDADFTKNGEYVVYALNNEGKLSDGDLLEFYVEGIFAANHTFSSGLSTRLDLEVTIPGFHFCGDGTCDSDEGCSSCPSDCACSSGYECKNNVCVKKDTGGGSSGGGGSSSSYIPPATQNNTSNETSKETSGKGSGENQATNLNETTVCEENWKCSEWFECFNSKQKRVCVDLNNCGTEENKPEEVRSCSVCGNKVCEEGETYETCCSDCGCPKGYECKDNKCTSTTSFSSITGRFLTSPMVLISIIGGILVIILGFLLYKKKMK